MSQRDFSETELQSTSDLTAANRTLFLEKVRQSNTACQNGDFTGAVLIYTDALLLDPSNHILYSNRSAARLKQGQFLLALQDATKARELCPQWPKAYFRQGVALQCLGRYAESLASFSAGLAQDPNSKQLLSGLVEASVKSPLRQNLDPIFQQLKTMQLEQSAFVVISVVGQELLGAGQYHSAVIVLESALRIGSCSLKLRGSVFSALSSAYWALNQLDKAISYMQQDLSVAKSLGDVAGEKRAFGNLGSAYFSQGSYKEALTAHRYQLVLAMKCKDTHSASIALTSLGHVYTAIGDFPNALASHKQCVQLVKQMGNLLQEAREIGNVGAVYLAMGEFDLAVDCHTQHLRLAKKLSNQGEVARAYSNLGSSHHYKRNFSQAIIYHENVLRIAQQLGDRSIEARFNYRAYAGLGHAARCSGDYVQAKRWHEKQLEMALSARDKIGEGRACSNLGIVYQLLGEHDHALKLHQAHLTIARQLQDKAGQGRAFGNIGNAYSAAGYYEQAIKYHKQELTISKEVHDRSAEASTHGNLAVAYQALSAHEMALLHYRSHLNIARELKDTAGESCALLNLGNCLSSRQEFAEAVQYYEQYLMLSQELGDVAAEGKACHFLGYAHYCIGNYREAVRYYDQDLALAKDLQNKVNMGRAYCNLGLAHLALGNNDAALECQKYFLAIAHMTNNTTGKFRALGNIGDILIKMFEMEEAAKMFHRQLAIARQSREKALEAASYSALGLVHRLLKKYDKSLGYHTQELTLRQEMGDMQGESKALGHLGAVHISIGNYTHAVKCYQEQLERAQELQELHIEAQAFGNLAITRLNMGHYEEAIGFLEQQLGTLEQLKNTLQTQHDKARALGHLGNCYDAMGDFNESIKCQEQYLNLAISLGSHRDQERAYRGLGHSHKSLGNLQEALVCLEKRLVVSHELGSLEAKASAYGDLGNIHSALNNFDQAVNCLEHQRDIARELDNRHGTSDAISSLGVLFQKMNDYDGALRLHKMDLELSENIGLSSLQARAYGNIASVYEALKNYSEAVKCLEKQLDLTTDKHIKCLCSLALGRVLHTINETAQAINYLNQALQIAQSLNKLEDESKIRYALATSMIASKEENSLEEARTQVETAAQILETIRYDQRSVDAKTALFDLQTSCYHTLQQVLVAMGKEEEALVAAERCRARVMADNLRNSPSVNSINGRKLLYTCSEHIFDTVNKYKTHVIYYSIANDELFAWYLQPQKRIVRFHTIKIDESVLNIPVTHKSSVPSDSAGSLLEQYINYLRDSLGVSGDESIGASGNSTWRSASSENLIDDFANERQGFLRMVNRNHLLNSSNYSLSSLFSLGSISSLQGSTRSSVGSLHGGSTRSRRSNVLPSWQGPSCLHVLYNLLLAPFEDLLPDCGSSGQSGLRDVILVLENDLYLVPFALLRSAEENGEYFGERCSLLTVDSLQTLRQKSRFKNRDSSENLNSSLVVGGPRLNILNTEAMGWSESAIALQEATMVAEMLQTKPLISSNATKEAVLAELTTAECVHFAVNVSWKMGAIILSPGNLLDSQPSSKRYYPNSSSELENEDENHDLTNGNIEMPPLTDFILTKADLSAMPGKVNAKLVVLSCNSASEPISGSAVANLANIWLSAGAQAVLVSLWPVPETAAKILLRAFYSALLQGARVANALAEAMQTVQHTKHFNHPANWAGFMLIGGNIRLSNKVALIGQALCELLKQPEKCRDALRVCLHLVEKSLQRISRGQKNAMYTTQKSINNKTGSVNGWKELLMAVGFRFEAAGNGIASSVFFPQSDPEERLSQCSASLQSLLALTQTTVHALSKLVSNSELSSEEIINVMRNIVTQFQNKSTAANPTDNEGLDISLSVRLWRISGCHELLASLGFDLMEVGQDQVTLRTGKQANKRNSQFVLQALLALFDTQEAPKTLELESSSSTESLVEIGENEAKSTIDFSQRKSSMGKLSSGASNYTHFQRPSLAARRMAISSRSAFISYVRRRGEPDGGQTDAIQNSGQPMLPSVTSSFDNSLNNTDSELSDGYTTQQMLKLTTSKLMSFEKDAKLYGNATFTPSPPITLQGIDSNVSLALAHQTRIRNLYTNSAESTHLVNSSGVISHHKHHRPDSSSSASSATDFEGSGHATVLRRAHMQQGSATLPPLPPPRQLMDSLRPMVPVYNNVMPPKGSKAKGASFLDSTSCSDSDFEKSFDVRTVPGKTRKQIKLHQQYIHHVQHHQPQISHYQDTQSVSVSKLKEQFNFMDRLSVRTELSANTGATSKSIAAPSSLRKPLKANDDDILKLSASNLYFSPADLESVTTNMVDCIDDATAIVHHSQSHQHYLSPQKTQNKKEIKSNQPTGSASTSSSNKTSTKKAIQESILLHQMNREMTPTISDVYHERNIGLGLAPPLSKLLLSKNYDDNEAKPMTSSPCTSNQALNKIMSGNIVDAINEMDLNDDREEVTSCTASTAKMLMACGSSSTEDRCHICGSSDMLCDCNAALANGGPANTLKTKKGSSSATAFNKWLTNNIVKSSDLSVNNLSLLSGLGSNSSSTENSLSTVKRACSPFSELSRRDEGDGRSFTADSNCSGSFRTIDVTVTTPTSSTITKSQLKSNLF